jgi:hypothetical protein
MQSSALCQEACKKEAEKKGLQGFVAQLCFKVFVFSMPHWLFPVYKKASEEFTFESIKWSL